MKYTTYSRYVPGLLETLNLQALLDQLADFLLQSGFAGGPYSHPFWGEFGEEDPDRSLDALRQAILQALMDSGQLTPDMLNVLRGDSTGDAQKDQQLQKQLADLLDQIVQKLMDEGYLNLQQAPKMPGAQQPVLGPGGMAKEAAQQVQDRKSTRLNSSHPSISYAVLCLNDPATTEIYTLSLHDALPILQQAPKMPGAQQPVLGPGGMAKEAAQQV